MVDLGFVLIDQMISQSKSMSSTLLASLKKSSLKRLDLHQSKYVLPIVLFSIGFAICLFYGRIGFAPIDQSIVFDGGWRIYSGQLPYRDFVTPNGLIAILIQSLFFRVFGVTWFAYCLHSAVFNGLFCVLVFVLLRTMQGSVLICFIYAALSGIVFYPPYGVPSLEQHSFFFILLAITLIGVARNRSHTIQVVLWVIVPPILILAFLSKQIPGIFGIGLVALLLLTIQSKKIIVYVVESTCVSIIALMLLALLQSIDLDQFKFYVFELPSQVGVERSVFLRSPFLAITKFIETTRYWNLNSVVLIHLLAIPSLIGLLSYWLIMRRALFSESTVSQKVLRFFNNYVFRELTPYDWGFALLLAEGMIFLCTIFALLTNQEPLNGIPYLFLSVGILNIKANQIIKLIARPYWRFFWLIALNLAFLSVISTDAYIFNLKVNSTRFVHSFDYHFDSAQLYHGSLPPKLQFMQWIYPSPMLAYTPQDFNAVFEFLNSSAGNFYLHGDSSILYGLTGKPSISPSLWFHPGLTIPVPGTPYDDNYQLQLQNAMEKYRPYFVVIETNHAQVSTQEGSLIANYPLLTKILEDRAVKKVLKAGVFTIYDITATDVYKNW